MEYLNLNISQIVEDLEKGRKSAHHIRDLIMNQRQGFNCDDDHHYYKGLDGHSMVVLTALESALTALHNSPNIVLPKKDKRGCYKRRKGEEERIVETPILCDDGFAWRKYGQKVILHSTHLRSYFRCTHKEEQKCMATKQVQQISENPQNYRLIYHGKHTCKLTPQFSLNSINTPTQYPNSPVYIDFGRNRNTPSSNQAHPFNPPFSNSGAMMEQEHDTIKVEPWSINSSPSTSMSTTPGGSEVLDGPFGLCEGSPHRIGDYIGDDYTMGEDFSNLEDLGVDMYDYQLF